MTLNKIVLGLLVVSCLVVCSYGFDDSLQSQRYRRLVQHYVSHSRARRRMIGRPGFYWMCKRGNKISICGNPGMIAKLRKIGFRRNTRASAFECNASNCKRGSCVLGKCICRKGWTGAQCVADVNECRLRIHPCDHNCLNTPGSYKCTCRPGHKLHRNKRQCVPLVKKSARSNLAPANLIDRTEPSSSKARSSSNRGSYSFLGNSTQPFGRRYQSKSQLYYRGRAPRSCRKGCSYQCIYYRGVESCLCPTGFSLATNGRSCIDINECLDTANFECSEKEQCTNTIGSYSCTCQAGYTLRHTIDGKSCRDVNECLNGDHTCDPSARCINTVGWFACECPPGLQKSAGGLNCAPVERNQVNNEFADFEIPVTETPDEFDIQ